MTNIKRSKDFGVIEEGSYDITDPAKITSIMEEIYLENQKFLAEEQNKKNEINLDRLRKNISKKYEYEQGLYEEFSESAFETKMRLDVLFFESIFSKLPGNYSEKMSDAVGCFYRTVKELYEQINIKAENISTLSESILFESEREQEEKFKGILSKYIDREFYRIPPEKRPEKFLNESKDYAEELIKSGETPNDAIQQAIKSCVTTKLVEEVAIPRVIQHRVRYLLEDANYALIFDQNQLRDKWNEFRSQAKSIGRIVALTM